MALSVWPARSLAEPGSRDAPKLVVHERQERIDDRFALRSLELLQELCDVVLLRHRGQGPPPSGLDEARSCDTLSVAISSVWNRSGPHTDRIPSQAMEIRCSNQRLHSAGILTLGRNSPGVRGVRGKSRSCPNPEQEFEGRWDIDVDRALRESVEPGHLRRSDRHHSRKVNNPGEFQYKCRELVREHS